MRKLPKESKRVNGGHWAECGICHRVLTQSKGRVCSECNSRYPKIEGVRIICFNTVTHPICLNGLMNIPF